MKPATIIKALTAVALLGISNYFASAASTDTWVGGSANFSTTANWSYSAGSGPLASGDSLIFGSTGSTSPNNDITSLSVSNLTFNSGASAFTFSGNAFTLTGNLTNNAAGETLNGIAIDAGVVTTIKNLGSGTLALGALTESGGGTVLFKTTSPISTSTADQSYQGGNMLGGWAVIDNGNTTYDWAHSGSTGGNNITAPTYVAPSAVLHTPSNLGNVKCTSSVTLADAQSTWQSILVSGAVTLNYGAWNLYLNSGGLILQGGGTYTGSGQLICNTSANAFFVHVPDTGTIGAAMVNGASATTLYKDGPGTLTLNNAANAFTGNIVINAGTIAVGSGIAGTASAHISSNLGDIGSGQSRTITINNGGNLTFTGGNVFGYDTAPLSTVTLVVNQGGVFQVGPSSGAGNFSKIGAVNLNGGTISVGNGDNGYHGALALLGTVTVGGSTPSTIGTLSGATTYDVVNLGQSNPNISSGTFNVADVTGDSGVDLTVSAGLANQANAGAASSLTKTGAGTMALTGANTYSGTTTINAGTLLVNNTSGSGSVGVNNANTTLGGSGTISGAVTMNAGTILSPGINGTAGNILTCSGGVTFSGGAKATFDLSASASGANDKVAVTGTLTIGSADTITINPITASTLDTADYTLATATSVAGSGTPTLAWGTSTPANPSYYSIVKNATTVVLHYVVPGAPPTVGTVVFSPVSPVYVGTTVTASAVVGTTGTGLSWKWQSSANSTTGSDGTWADITGATGSSSTATYSPSTANAGTRWYRVVATDSNGTTNGIGAQLTVNSADVGTTTFNPVSPAYVGNAVTASATVTGASGTTTYQWQSSSDNSTWGNASGASTSLTYAPNTASVGTTYYRLQATDGGNTKSGTGAALQVNAASAPIITGLAITSSSINAGQGTTSSVTSVTGTLPITNQWQFSYDSIHWSAISGATNNSYAITNASPNDSGYYRLVATNSVGTTASSALTLTVGSVLIDPTHNNGSFENNSSKTTFASGNVPNWVVWPGVSTASNDSGSDADAANASQGTRIAYLQSGNADYNLTTYTIRAGDKITYTWDWVFVGRGNATAQLGYWNGSAVVAITGTDTTNPDTTSRHLGLGTTWTVPVNDPSIGHQIAMTMKSTGNYPEVDNFVLSINKANPLTITVNPVSLSVIPNGSSSFSVTATSDGSITGYQWYQGASGNTSSPVSNGADGNGTVFSGATTATLSFSSASAADNGNTYWCQVTSSYNGGTVSANSTAAALTVYTPKSLSWMAVPADLNWNTTSLDWSNTVTLAGSVAFSSFDNVTFDSTGSGGTITITGAVQPNSVTVTGGSYTLAASGTGKITGAEGLTVSGGTLAMSATNNDYLGVTTVSGGGTLSLAAGAISGSPSPIGAATSASTNIVLNNGTLQFTATSGSTDHGLTLNSGGGTVNVAASDALTISGTIAGTGGGGLTKVGNGTLTLSGGNTYDGGTIVSAGTAKFSNASAFGTRTVTLNGGTIQAGGGFTLANNLTVSGSSSFDLAGNNTTLSGNLSGSAALNFNNSGGAATVTLNGNSSSYGGTITFNTGNAVSFVSANAGSANAAWVFNDNTLDRVRINIGNGTLNFGSIGGSGQLQNDTPSTASIISVGALNTSTTFSGTINDNGTGTLALTKVGSGALTLSGGNTYTGNTTITAGTLALSGSGSLASSANIIIAGATFDVSALSSTFTLGSGKVLTGSGGTIAGSVNLNAGSLALNYTSGTPSLSVTNGTLAFNGNAVTVTVSGGALGAGSYKLVAKNTGGSVTGNLPASVTVNGAGATAPAALQLVSGELYLVVGTTSAALASSANPSGFKDSVTFTAAVQTNGVTAGNASGTVTFYTNSVAYATNGLSSGATNISLSVLPRGTNLITAIYSGDVNYLPSTNSLNQVVTNHPPVAGNATYTRNAGIYALRITISDLLTNVTDADSDTITLVGTGTSTNGVIVSLSGTNLLNYYNTNNVNDQFSYTVTDGFGGTNTGLVSIVVSNAAVGTVSGEITSFTNNMANLTFHGIPNYSYITERSTNLNDWVDISTNTAASTNGVINVSDTFGDLGGVPPSSAYYRLKWQP
jgi:autotransporter-associated beta strand protein